MADIYFREHRRIPLSFSQQGSVKALSFSNDGRYLAIGYGGGADVWDLEDNSRNSPLLTTHRRSPHPPLIGLAWFPHQSRIVLAHCNGIVYTINVTKRKFSTAGIRSNGFHEDAVSVAILDDTVFVVAFKTSIQVLEIRPGSEDTEDELVLLGYLRSPPAAAGLDVGNINVTAVFALSERRIIVSYNPHIVVEWEITTAPFNTSVLGTFHVSGAICDLSANGNFLVANDLAGGYELHSFRTGKATPSFVPRDPTTKLAQPITTAQFLSHNCVVGGGAGQLIIWDTQAARLQNLRLGHDQAETLIKLFCCIYKNESDVAWIASAVSTSKYSNKEEVLLWEWNGNGELVPSQNEARPAHKEPSINNSMLGLIFGFTLVTLLLQYLLPGVLHEYVAQYF